MYFHSLALLICLTVACGLPSGDAGTTWYGHVAPILDRHCGECHSPGGVGGVDLVASPSLLPLMLQKIDAGDMPPWPPGPESVPLGGVREVPAQELAVLRRWQGAMGDLTALNRQARGVDFGRAPDASIAMTMPYLPSQPAGDTTRCFLLPPIAAPTWITAYKWQLGNAGAMHHVLGVVVTAADVGKIPALEARDAESGWDCAADTGVPPIGYLSNTTVGPDSGGQFSEGYGVRLEDGDRIVLIVHYVALRLHQPDVSGVSLWTANSAKPVSLYIHQVPAEVPSPFGWSIDPSDPRSRAYAAAHSLNPTALADNDAVLKACGRSLADYERLAYSDLPQDHFYVTNTCTSVLPQGEVLSVHIHTHTRAVSARIELGSPDSVWTPLLDIPRWRWEWESTYNLAQPFHVGSGWKIRTSCTWDNGVSNQWSALDHEPGHDGPAVPPLEPPRYHFWGPSRDDEMCNGILEIGSE